MTTLNDDFLMGAHIRRYWILKWERKFKCSHSSMLRTTTISCFNTRKFYLLGLPSFRSCPGPGYLHAVCCRLTYEEDDDSSIVPRMEDHSPEDNILAHCLPSIAEGQDDDTEKHFLTVSLDDDFWNGSTSSREALVHP